MGFVVSNFKITDESQTVEDFLENLTCYNTFSILCEFSKYYLIACLKASWFQ